MGRLREFLPETGYAIVCTYREQNIEALVVGTTIHSDDSLSLSCPRSHTFRVGDQVTVHIDNRTGVEVLDLDLKVYRASYKGLITALTDQRLEVCPIQYQLVFGMGISAEFSTPGYRFPQDMRPARELPVSTLIQARLPDEKERENNLGVWITRAEQRPHTTVMAFLSSTEDDIFVISHTGTFKSACIHRDPRCCFAIDHRSSFLFEKAIDWNFTIIETEASLIPFGTDLFYSIQAQFVQKNPWEEPFFTDRKVELIHLRPLRLLCAGKNS